MASIDNRPGPESYANGMPSRAQKGGSISESLDQQDGQSPLASASGSRQDGHSGGKATSVTRRSTVRKPPPTRDQGEGPRLVSGFASGLASGLAETSSLMLQPYTIAAARGSIASRATATLQDKQCRQAPRSSTERCCACGKRACARR